MAVRINREVLATYADKLFLAVALLFLIFTTIMLMLPSNPRTDYRQVAAAFQTAEKDRDNPEAKLDALFDPAVDTDARALKLLKERANYAQRFASTHTTQVPPWADPNQKPAYVASKDGSTKGADGLAMVPPMEKRVAPYLLKVVQDKAYLPTGKEGTGELLEANNIYLVAGQATIDVGRQTEMSREVNAQSNKWRAQINTTLLTDYEVQRRQMRNDGTFNDADWKTVPTVRYEDVTRTALKIRRPPEPNAKLFDSNTVELQRYRDADTAFKTAVYANLDRILHPPFFEMAGKEYHPAYDQLGVEESAVVPVPVDPTAALPEGASGEPPVAPAPVAKLRAVAELIFNDRLPASESGKTFQYRVRIKFHNPIFGAPLSESNSGDERYVVELPGQWSDPSDPVTLEPMVKFFFTGRFADKINLDLYRWIYGNWTKPKNQPTFELGDSIDLVRTQALDIPAGRRAVAVKLPNVKVSFNAGVTLIDVQDITITRGGMRSQTVKLVYYDHLTDKLCTRIAWVDRNEKGTWDKKINLPKPEPPKRRTGPSGQEYGPDMPGNYPPGVDPRQMPDRTLPGVPPEGVDPYDAPPMPPPGGGRYR